jgi:hypothetical protein
MDGTGLLPAIGHKQRREIGHGAALAKDARGPYRKMKADTSMRRVS